jgi:hypothetical protein
MPLEKNFTSLAKILEKIRKIKRINNIIYQLHFPKIRGNQEIPKTRQDYIFVFPILFFGFVSCYYE